MPITINGSGTLTGISAGGLPDGIVDTDMLATSAVSAAKLGTNTFVSYAVICDQKAQGADGGTFTSGAWRQRDLNTELFDPDGIVSISSNEFTLQAGTYFIEFMAPAFRIGRNQSRLYDVTGDAAVQVSHVTTSDDGADGDMSETWGWSRVTIAAANNYRIDHQCSVTRSNTGYGNPGDFAEEIYTVVTIYKEA